MELIRRTQRHWQGMGPFKNQLLILFFACLLFIAGYSCSAFAEEPSLKTLESTLFGRTYEQDDDGQRIKRLEQLILGHEQSGTPVERQAQLMRVYATQNPDKPPIPKAVAAPLETDPSVGNSPSNGSPREDTVSNDATSYPTVTLMEQRVLHQTYENEPIRKRLERLEQAVFKQIYNELPMVDRVDQLTLKVLPEDPLNAEESGYRPMLPKTNPSFSAHSPAIYSKLTGLEEQLFGRSYGGELISDRLKRMETRVFGGPQEGSVDDRMDNLLMQYRKAIPNPQQPQVGQPQIYTPGGSVSPYGQQFTQTLPNGVRQRFEARGYGVAPGAQPNGAPGQGQVFQSPDGSWTVRTYTNIIPNGSIYRGPGAGQSAVPPAYTPPSVSPFYNNNQVPAYTSPQGNSSGWNAGSALAILENQFFGQTYDNATVMERLNQLEYRIFNQTYPFEAIESRVRRLQQTVIPRG